MIYVSAQPATEYYTWQVETYINNFIKHGIRAEDIVVLCSVEYNIIPESWRALSTHYKDVKFHFYRDTRTSKDYVPSIYFNLVKQWVKDNPEYRTERVFYHDSDIVFTRPPKLNWMGDDCWYLSDTNSYINYDYVLSKGVQQYHKMCELVNIDPLIPKLFNKHSGGAQYVGYGMTYSFWDKVERDSITLYDYLTRNESNYSKKYEGDYPIQKWTSGMWGLLWNIWTSGYATEVRKELDFTWSTNPMIDIDSNWILHNAGVVGEGHGLFFKGSWINTLPYGVAVEPDKDRASWYYWNEVMETGKQSVFNI